MLNKVLFVCLGNICRSPTAHGVLEHKIATQGLAQRIQVDSAGTSDWHIGRAPDNRSIKVADTRGYNLRSQTARQVSVHDFDEFDYILAMDNHNLQYLQSLKPAYFTGHLSLFLDFHPHQPLREMPDPYHGGEAGFIQVLDLAEAASDTLLAHILASA